VSDLSPEPVAKYRFAPNHCDCHPETCCCASFVLMHGDAVIAKSNDAFALGDLCSHIAELERQLTQAEQFKADAMRWKALEHLWKWADQLDIGSNDSGFYTVNWSHVEERCSTFWIGGEPHEVFDKIANNLGLIPDSAVDDASQQRQEQSK